MSDTLQTRRLIVTLPDTSGEEADEIATFIEDRLNSTDQDWAATVTHALGESLPNDLKIINYPSAILVVDTMDDESVALTPFEARQLAGVLLAIPGVIDAEPPSVRHYPKDFDKQQNTRNSDLDDECGADGPCYGDCHPTTTNKEV